MRYRPQTTSVADTVRQETVQMPNDPPTAVTSAVADALANPAMDAAATTSCGRTMSHTAQLEGPGRVANPSRMVDPVHTA